MGMKRLVVVAFCVAAVGSVGASSALGGEVKGPPGAGNVTPKDVTHANSICSFSGLNDYVNGPTDFHVQSFGQDVRAGRANPKEFNPGDACRGGSNPYRPPS